MSKLDELIQELCPDGVEYKKIKEVYKRIKGTPITAAKMKEIADDNGDVKIFAGGKTIVYAFEKDIPNANITRIPAVLVQSRGVIDVVYYDLPFTFKNEMWAYTHENPITLKFLYYVLKNNINKFRDEAAGMGSMPQISLKVTEDFNMPVPPLEVQQEIVHLLDDFTAKTAELQAELNKEYEARKKQYEYYRETVLNDNLDSMTVKIGDVADLKAGATPKTSNPEFWENGTIPWMSSGEVNQGKVTYTEKKITELGYNSSSTKMLPSETVVIALAGQGKTRGTVAITQIPLCTNQSLCGICAKDELNSMYLYHYLKSRYEDLRAISNGDGTRGGLNLKMIANYDIPLPPLEVQMKIVNILDKLDSINNDMYSSINNEIESRQKQYEFYRDKLLTFKELK